MPGKLRSLSGSDHPSSRRPLPPWVPSCGSACGGWPARRKRKAPAFDPERPTARATIPTSSSVWSATFQRKRREGERRRRDGGPRGGLVRAGPRAEAQVRRRVARRHVAREGHEVRGGRRRRYPPAWRHGEESERRDQASAQCRDFGSGRADHQRNASADHDPGSGATRRALPPAGLPQSVESAALMREAMVLPTGATGCGGSTSGGLASRDSGFTGRPSKTFIRLDERASDDAFSPYAAAVGACRQLRAPDNGEEADARNVAPESHECSHRAEPSGVPAPSTRSPGSLPYKTPFGLSTPRRGA